ncbi:MAG: metal-dependent hydrolase [Gammaproteobacteria bacterium]|nr:metal-dependent hydrolase [Gammaproteobacteria bacterium]
MANFKTHVNGGIVIGTAFVGIGIFFFDLNMVQSFAIFTMGVLGGILPDLDSNSGKPLPIISGLVSVLIPLLLLGKVGTINSISPEFLISYFIIFYVILNYVVCGVIKKFTVHRGIMHSIPFSFLVAEFAYILFISSGKNMATIAAFAIFFGCIIHLVLDELNSIKFKFGFIPTLSRSSGTAFKLYTKGFLTNFFILCAIIATTWLIFSHFNVQNIMTYGHSIVENILSIKLL